MEYPFRPTTGACIQRQPQPRPKRAPRKMIGTLTAQQAEIYDYIRRRIHGGLPPTYREIMKTFGFSGPNGAKCHVRSLEKKGFIKTERTSRGIRLTSKRTEGNVDEWSVKPMTEAGAVLWHGDSVIAVFPHDAEACERVARLLNADECGTP